MIRVCPKSDYIEARCNTNFFLLNLYFVKKSGCSHITTRRHFSFQSFEADFSNN